MEKFTAKELAQMMNEAFTEPTPLGQDRKDWALEILEKHEKDAAPNGEFFQSLRAELFRLGWRHSASED